MKPDKSTLDALYRRALAEGGNLVIYAGGDAPDQLDETKADFEAAFPGIKAEFVVDLSKYHDLRVDNQLRTNTVVFDVAQLQTIHNFPRWKQQGVLMRYKPIDWKHIYKDFKDHDGAYTGVFMSSFSTNVNPTALPKKASWPIDACDWLKPELKNRIVNTYPNDDDAILLWFRQVVAKYGYDYLYKLKAQNPKLVRGTSKAYALVQNGTYAATMTADGGLKRYEGLPTFTVPKHDPFVMWPQQAAIFKKAPHPAAAKLYMSWRVSKKVQENEWSWSVRNDVKAPEPFKSVWDYPEGNPLVLGPWMAEEYDADRFRREITRIFGPVQGPNPNSPGGEIGTHPVKAYPH